MKNTRIHPLVWLIPFLLALTVNLNVLQNGLGWDDEIIVLGLAKPESWTDLVLPSMASPSKANSSYYRPLVNLSYQLDFLIWGRSPFGFHLSVLLAHLLNTVLVYFFTLRLLKNGPTHRSAPTNLGGPPESGPDELCPHIFVPLVAASLFAVHPVHVEAVAWIAG